MEPRVAYVSLDPDTLEIVDRFVGTQEDVDQRSSELEHVVVPPPYDASYVIPSRDPNTGFITFTPDIDAYNADQAARVSTQWTFLRRERDDKLKASDWIVAVRTHRSRMNKAAWRAYRQALRDSRRPSRTSKTRSHGRHRLLNFSSSNRHVNRLPTVKFDGRHQDVRHIKSNFGATIGVGTDAPTGIVEVQHSQPTLVVQQQATSGGSVTSYGKVHAASGTLHIQSGIDATSDSKGDIVLGSVGSGTKHVVVKGATSRVGIGSDAPRTGSTSFPSRGSRGTSSPRTSRQIS